MNIYDRRPSTDSWSLRIMREAKTVRDLAGETIPELDEHLRWSEEAAAATGVQAPATPLADTHNVPLRDRKPSYGTAPVNPATDKQLWLIKKLVDERGLNIADWAPTNKRDASTMIDKLMGMRVAPTAAPVRMATEKQVAFLTSLLAERAHGYDDLDPAAVSAARASSLIDELMVAPRAKVASHGISEGRYAFQPEGAQAQFYRVSRTGRIYIQAGPSEHPYNGKNTEAMQWIRDNERDAAALYGRLLGICGRCGRELTDENSRALGLGPICAEK